MARKGKETGHMKDEVRQEVSCRGAMETDAVSQKNEKSWGFLSPVREPRLKKSLGDPTSLTLCKGE